MEKRKSELHNLVHQWQCQLEIIPVDKDDIDLSCWATSLAEQEEVIHDVQHLPNMPNPLQWNNYMDDTGSVGGDNEGPMEEGPVLMEELESLEENDYEEIMDPMFEVLCEEDNSESEVGNGHTHKRRKIV